ncbi:MAG: phosphoribosyltransferase family protein [Halodesulfurarchaeum sp.]
MNRAEKAGLQLRAVGVLRTLKETRTYEELAADTGLPAGDLNRYVNGHVLPSADRAREIVADLGYELVADEVRDRVRMDEDGYIDNSGIVFDQPLLDMVAPVASETLDFDPPDVVLTAATDGITLAAALSSHFDADCVYAKKDKETAVEEFIEARLRLESGIEITYYLPAEGLSAGDTVLVVDDLIRSGETQEILLDIADQAEAEVVGVFTLIAVGEEGLKRARALTEAPVGALVELE